MEMMLAAIMAAAAAAAGMAAVELLIKMQAVAAEVATRIQIGVTQLCILKGFKQAMESL
jgi:hypothetical protein